MRGREGWVIKLFWNEEGNFGIFLNLIHETTN